MVAMDLICAWVAEARRVKKAHGGLGFARFVFGDELFDGVEHLRELLVMAGLHGLDAAGQIAVGIHQAAQLHKVRMMAMLTSTARCERSTLESMATPCSVSVGLRPNVATGCGHSL
ncbi:MAG: hypothetical protein R3E99_00365 [Burkholderiaceae bacterium]